MKIDNSNYNFAFRANLNKKQLPLLGQWFGIPEKSMEWVANEFSARTQLKNGFDNRVMQLFPPDSTHVFGAVITNGVRSHKGFLKDGESVLYVSPFKFCGPKDNKRSVLNKLVSAYKNMYSVLKRPLQMSDIIETLHLSR